MLPDNWFELLKNEYPKRPGGQGWGSVKKLVPRAIQSGATWDEILAGTKAYKKWVQSSGKAGTEYIRMAQTFFGPGEWWAEEYEVEAEVVKTDWNAVAEDLGIPVRQEGEEMEAFRRRIGVATVAKERRLRSV
jgi:hypothetical protein